MLGKAVSAIEISKVIRMLRAERRFARVSDNAEKHSSIRLGQPTEMMSENQEQSANEQMRHVIHFTLDPRPFSIIVEVMHYTQNRQADRPLD